MAIGPAIVAAAVVESYPHNLATFVQAESFDRFALVQDVAFGIANCWPRVVLAGDLGRKQTELFWRWPPDQLEPVSIVVTINPPGVDQLRLQQVESEQPLDGGDAINVDADEVIHGDADGPKPPPTFELLDR